MIEGPRSVRKDEFKQLIKLVDTCFPSDKKKGGMLARWPHCYLKDKLKNNVIIKKDNKVAVHIGCIPQELIVGNKKMKIMGIHAVATNPKYRGQGLMSILLKHCINKMQKEEISFSYLSGDRQRYGHFGWENAGREWIFCITDRSLGLKNRTIKSKIRGYRGTSEDLNTIIRLYVREPFRIGRSKQPHQIMMGRKGREVYLSKDDEGNSAYVVLSGDGKVHNVCEFGSEGSPEKLFDLFCYIFKRHDLEKMDVFSPHYHRLNKFFFGITTAWEIKSTYMIKIINLLQTLKGFSRQIKDKCCRHNGSPEHVKGEKVKESLTLLIKDTDQRASIYISGNNVNIDDGLTNNRLYFSETEMVRLIFGMSSPGSLFDLGKHAYSPRRKSLIFIRGLLDCIFPLDFYIWHNDGV